MIVGPAGPWRADSAFRLRSEVGNCVFMSEAKKKPAPSRTPSARPFWMPSGGRAALWFWGGLSALLALGLIGFERDAASQGRDNRRLREQVALVTRNNTTLRSEIDKLQTELLQKGSALREAQGAITAVKTQSEQQDEASVQIRQTAVALATGFAQAIAVGLPPLPGDQFKVWADGDRIVIRIASPLLFDGGDIGLNAKGNDLLKRVAGALKALPADREIVVEGYTGAGEPPKGISSNWEYGARRAASVVRALAEAGPLDGARLSARGCGAAHPIDAADPAKNRRIEIVLHAPGATPAPAAP